MNNNIKAITLADSYKYSDDDKKLHDKAMENFHTSNDYYKEQYTMGKDDLKFTLGEQWPDDIKQQRSNEGRPCLTENRTLPFVHKVVNDIRQQRPSIRAIPADSGADEETAKIMRGVIRNIESVSDAESAYDTAAFCAITQGMGFVRVCTDYAGEDTFDQEIRIERINNALNVYIDPKAQRKDYADAEFAFVFEDMKKDDFKKRYPNVPAEGFDTTHEDWEDDDSIRIAEYFYKTYEKKKLYKYGDITSYEEVEGLEPDDEREVEICRVKYCKITSNHILEQSEFPSKYIPIVPVLGFEVTEDGKRTCYSLIHTSRDPQVLFNIWKSASAEVIALQPKAPFIGYEGQFANKERWANSNKQAPAFLEVKPLTIGGTVAPLPQRQPAPSGSLVMLQEAQSAAEGIQATLGIYDASLGKETNDISGKAIIARQLQSDNATFHFTDNLTTALKHLGRIMIDMIPNVYSEPRIMRIMGEDGTSSMIPVNQPAVKVEGGNYKTDPNGDEYFDLQIGKYDVEVEVGPSFQTKRQEAANAIIELAKADPRILEVGGDILMDNLDIPNKGELKERIQAIMDPSLLGDDIEAQRLQNLAGQVQQLTAQLEEADLALQMKGQNEAMEMQLKKQEQEIKAMRTMSEIKEIEARAMKLMAEANTAIPAEAAKDYADAMESMKAELDDVKGAINVFLEERESDTPE
jgi:hypothetical protein